MKIAFCTDLHIGVRGGSNIFREYFEWYYKTVFFPYLKDNAINTVFCGGDFFDNRTSLNIKDINFVINVFIPLLIEYNITFYCIAGNHDVVAKNTNEDNSLRMLSLISNNRFIVADMEPMNVVINNTNIQMIPWINNSNYQTIVSYIKDCNEKQNTIMLGHFEINGMKMYKNSIPCESELKSDLFSGYKKVLSGHFHHPSKLGNIEYIGALFHYNWQDYGDTRGFTTYDTSTSTFEYIENPYSLFVQFVYDDKVLKLSDNDLKHEFEGKFVRMIIESEPTNKLQFLSFVSNMKRIGCIDFSIEDMTIIKATTQSKISTDGNIKSILEYCKDYIERNFDDSANVYNLSETIYNDAIQQMSKGE